MKKTDTKHKGIWKPFLRFYTRFSIPWWLYVLSLAAGLLYTEATLQLTEYAVLINQGDLYNSVILWYVFLTVGSTLLSMGQTLFKGYAAQRITLRARSVLWKKVLHLQVAQLEKQNPASVISSMVNEAAAASDLITYLTSLVSSLYGFIRAYVILYQYNHSVSNWLLVLYPLSVFTFIIGGKIRYSTMKSKYATLNQMTSFFSEHIGCAKYIKAQQMEQQEAMLGEKVIRKRFWADVRYTLLTTVSTSLYSLYDRLGMVVVAVEGSRQIREGRMEQTGLNNCHLYSNNNNMYFSELTLGYASIKGCQGTLSKINETMELEEEKLCEGAPYKANTQQGIVLCNVSFGYTPEKQVLRNITCTIPYGKRVALIGNNGSGKSTLLKLLLGLYPVDSGSVQIDGNPMDTVRLSEIRSHFNYVQQDCGLFCTTIRENILYGIERTVSEEELIQAAKAAQIHDFIQSLPDGYETKVVAAGTNFSGGQRQRMALARAFLKEADYLFLDEAGANLDRPSYNKIWDVLCEKMKGRSIIYIAHDISQIQQADYVLVLNRGCLEAAGSREEVLKSSPTYRQYLQAGQ